MTEIYQKLAKHLDNLPGGFPETETGVELRILKRLFTPREAEIAMGLSMVPAPASEIAPKFNLHVSDMSLILESMSRKGLVFRAAEIQRNYPRWTAQVSVSLPALAGTDQFTPDSGTNLWVA